MSEHERGLLRRFGEVRRIGLPPGPYFRRPLQAGLRRAGAAWPQNTRGVPELVLDRITAENCAVARRELGVEILAVRLRRIALIAPAPETPR